MADALAAPVAFLALTPNSIESTGGFIPRILSERSPISSEPSLPILTLRHIPLPHERSPFLKKHQPVMAVMGHELKHVLAARGKGYDVLDVTAHPGTGYLGLTRFRGHIDPADYGVIAVAGSLATPFGPAEGYGSDFMQAHVAAHQAGKVGIEGFISGAAAIDDQYPDKLQTKMVEIMTYMERVMGMPAIPGYMIDAIYERAALELVLESANQTWNPQATESMHTFVDQMTSDYDDRHKQYLVEKEMQDQTYVIDNGIGITDFVVVTGGYITEVTTVCNGCGGKNGQHTTECTSQNLAAKTIDPFRQPQLVVGNHFPDEYLI